MSGHSRHPCLLSEEAQIDVSGDRLLTTSILVIHGGPCGLKILTHTLSDAFNPVKGFSLRFLAFWLFLDGILLPRTQGL